MNSVSIFLLKCLRHGYARFFSTPTKEQFPVLGLEESNDLIYDILSKDKPCMIARYGANELNCVLNYIEIKYGDHNLWKNIKGDSYDWWWNKGMSKNMLNGAGFFPITDENLSRFAELMLEDTKELNALAVFPAIRDNVPRIIKYIPKSVPFFSMISYDFFLYDSSWIRVLEGKKILVIHPFKELIESQYVKRQQLFKQPNSLPEFELLTLKAVQSIGGVNEQGFENWFEGLEWMITEVDKIDFDIALLGCGAYGFPLAAHIKRIGKKAVHIGGQLQLFFGIKGSRWEDPNYGIKYGIRKGTYAEIVNHPGWVRPDRYRTNQAENVENACYW